MTDSRFASLAAFALLALTACAQPQLASPDGARTASTQTIRAHFACSGGKSVDATFVNGAQSTVQLALSDGRSLTLPQAMSASGARYANKDETFVFWNKGNTAFIEENGKTTYEGCVTKSQ